jgi:hypothetical protein
MCTRQNQTAKNLTVLFESGVSAKSNVDLNMIQGVSDCYYLYFTHFFRISVNIKTKDVMGIILR